MMIKNAEQCFCFNNLYPETTVFNNIIMPEIKQFRDQTIFTTRTNI